MSYARFAQAVAPLTRPTRMYLRKPGKFQVGDRIKFFDLTLNGWYRGTIVKIDQMYTQDDHLWCYWTPPGRDRDTRLSYMLATNDKVMHDE